MCAHVFESDPLDHVRALPSHPSWSRAGDACLRPKQSSVHTAMLPCQQCRVARAVSQKIERPDLPGCALVEAVGRAVRFAVKEASDLGPVLLHLGLTQLNL